MMWKNMYRRLSNTIGAPICWNLMNNDEAIAVANRGHNVQSFMSFSCDLCKNCTLMKIGLPYIVQVFLSDLIEFFFNISGAPHQV
jgi:hypothetical protein